ncbi:hypothetical protein HNQ51_000257 [Inhella inkyongensis]|uniref:SPOR domain-containing protein n=1 Tax=Inhella inkyongensis TaxID=392593 RepID=A0A840S283_9BURK|nr:hypothetical protein [Inhella inkyongensis]MBB5202964.1 hypothetical protein [Inhella inkyongensis]
MMKTLLALLLAANALLFAWGQGWLGGNPGSEQREPERLAAQQRPEQMKLLDAAQAQRLRSAPPLCRQLGPFGDEASLLAAEAALQPLQLPPGQWRRESRELSAQWGVLSSAPENAADAERKRLALERFGLKARPQTVPGEAQASLLVARFDNPAAARAEAQKLREAHGLKALRVLELRPAQTQHWLRVLAWPAAQLKTQSSAWPGGPQPCSAAPTAPAGSAASTASAAI